jgi:DNA replication protein DnaC
LDWHAQISNPTIGDALLDGLRHNSHQIILKGKSMRKQSLTDSDYLKINLGERASDWND